MDIDPVLRKAVQGRIDSGYSRAHIMRELREAEYAEEEADMLYETIANEASAPTENEAVPTGPTTAPTVTPAVTHHSTNSNSFVSRHPVALGVGFVVVLLLVVGTSVAAWGDVSTWRNWIPFLSHAPYDETTLLTGIIVDMDGQSRIDSTGEFLVALEPRAADTPEAFEDQFSVITMLGALAGTSVPDAASIRMNVESSVDTSDPDKMLVTAQGTMDMEMDIIKVSVGGSLRGVGDSLYGRIDKMPALMQQNLDSIPINTWIQLPTQDEFRELQGTPSFSVPTAPPLLNSLPDDWHLWWEHMPKTLAATDNQSVFSAQMASVVDTFSDRIVETAGFDSVEREIAIAAMKAVERAWQTAPLTVFANQPTRERVDGEAVYRYDLAFTRERTMAFIEALQTELQATPALAAGTASFEELETVIESDIPSADAFARFNELVDVIVTVRPDGSLHGMHIETVVTSPDSEFTAQLRARSDVRYTYPDTPLAVTIPEDVHERTLAEIVVEQQSQVQRDAQNASAQLQLSSFRSSAEVYYNENRFSYRGVCEEYFPFPVMSGGGSGGTAELECVDSATAYVAQYPFDDNDEAFCVDANGFAQTVPYSPLTTAAERSACDVSSN